MSPRLATRELDSVTDAALQALRAFVALADRSLRTTDSRLTLRQYRTLATLAGHGPQTAGRLAELLGVDPSTVTRMCDRLARLRLLRRRVEPGDRRAVKVSLTDAGSAVVAGVAARRRAELGRALGAMDPTRRGELVAILGEFASALEAQGVDAPSLGWIT